VITSAEDKHRQYLGTPIDAIPQNELEVPTSNLPEGITQNDLCVFDLLYKNHCELILDAVVNLQFSLVESLWQQFWSRSRYDLQQRLLVSFMEPHRVSLPHYLNWQQQIALDLV